MKALMFHVFFLVFALLTFSQQNIKLKKKDRKRDVEVITTHGSILLRLSDSTPSHRDNFFAFGKIRFL